MEKYGSGCRNAPQSLVVLLGAKRKWAGVRVGEDVFKKEKKIALPLTQEECTSFAQPKWKVSKWHKNMSSNIEYHRMEGTWKIIWLTTLIFQMKNLRSPKGKQLAQAIEEIHSLTGAGSLLCNFVVFFSRNTAGMLLVQVLSPGTCEMCQLSSVVWVYWPSNIGLVSWIRQWYLFAMLWRPRKTSVWDFITSERFPSRK